MALTIKCDALNVEFQDNYTGSSPNLVSGDEIKTIAAKIHKRFDDMGDAAYRGVDDWPTSGSKNLVESGALHDELKRISNNIDPIRETYPNNVIYLNTYQTTLSSTFANFGTAVIPSGTYEMLIGIASDVEGQGALQFLDASRNVITTVSNINIQYSPASTQTKTNIQLTGDAYSIRIVSEDNLSRTFNIQKLVMYDIRYSGIEHTKEYIGSCTHDYNQLKSITDGIQKNLLNFDGSTSTTSGVTFTNNGDGTWTTTTSATTLTSNITKYITIKFPKGMTSRKYVLSGCPPGGSDGTTTYYRIYIWDQTANQLVGTYDYGTGGIIKTTANWVPDYTHEYRLYIDLRSGCSPNGLVFKPMLCTLEAWNISHDFVQYKDSVDSLKYGEVVDLINKNTKNLVDITATTDTQNGATFTVNADHTVTVSGHASQYYGFRIVGVQGSTAYNDAVPIPRGTYILTGLPSGSSSTTFRYLLGLCASSTSTRTSTSIYDDYIFTVTNDTTRFDLTVYVSTNANFSTPITYKPMICPLDVYRITDKFVPYCPSGSELYYATVPLLRTAITDASAQALTNCVIAGDVSSIAGKTSGYVVVRTTVLDHNASHVMQVAEFSDGTRKTRLYNGSWQSWV